MYRRVWYLHKRIIIIVQKRMMPIEKVCLYKYHVYSFTQNVFFIKSCQYQGKLQCQWHFNLILAKCIDKTAKDHFSTINNDEHRQILQCKQSFTDVKIMNLNERWSIVFNTTFRYRVRKRNDEEHHSYYETYH